MFVRILKTSVIELNFLGYSSLNPYLHMRCSRQIYLFWLRKLRFFWTGTFQLLGV